MKTPLQESMKTATITTTIIPTCLSIFGIIKYFLCAIWRRGLWPIFVNLPLITSEHDVRKVGGRHSKTFRWSFMYSNVGKHFGATFNKFKSHLIVRCFTILSVIGRTCDKTVYISWLIFRLVKSSPELKSPSTDIQPSRKSVCTSMSCMILVAPSLKSFWIFRIFFNLPLRQTNVNSKKFQCIPIFRGKLKSWRLFFFTVRLTGECAH